MGNSMQVAILACHMKYAFVVAEALVPAQASFSESALRQRLMMQLNGAQGAAAPAGGPAWAQPGASWAMAAFQVPAPMPAAAATQRQHTHAAHAPRTAATAAPGEPDELMKFSGTALCEQHRSAYAHVGKTVYFYNRICRRTAVACFPGPSAPALRRGPQVVDLLSDSDDEQPTQSSPAAGSPAVDGHVAQLVDMGFTPEQAAQVSGTLLCIPVSAQS